jgi:hypothetical protein
MQDNTNPLRQYFRRPAIYLTLPSQGVGYTEGTLQLPENGELPIYPMTAIDEITSKTPDALFNGTAIVEIIKSCVPNISDPWSIPTIDIDPLLIAIRAASNGDKMEIETKCPSCEEEATYDVNLTRVLASFKPGDYKTPLILNELSVKFRPLLYSEVNKSNILQFEVQRMIAVLQDVEDDVEKSRKSTELIGKLNEMTIQILVSTIEYIKTPDGIVFEKQHIDEFLRNCDKMTFNKIKETSIELRSSTEAKPLDMKCMHCQHEYQQPFVVNVSNFFD